MYCYSLSDIHVILFSFRTALLLLRSCCYGSRSCTRPFPCPARTWCLPCTCPVPCPAAPCSSAVPPGSVLGMHCVHVARFGPASGTVPDHATGTDRDGFLLRWLLLLLLRGDLLFLSAGFVPVFLHYFHSGQRFHRRRLLLGAFHACQYDLPGIRRTWVSRCDCHPTDRLHWPIAIPTVARNCYVAASIGRHRGLFQRHFHCKQRHFEIWPGRHCRAGRHRGTVNGRDDPNQHRHHCERPSWTGSGCGIDCAAASDHRGSDCGRCARWCRAGPPDWPGSWSASAGCGARKSRRSWSQYPTDCWTAAFAGSPRPGSVCFRPLGAAGRGT